MRHFGICDYYEMLCDDLRNAKGLPLKFLNEMFMHRLEQKRERRSWESYLVRYGNMDKKTFTQYEYKKAVKQRKISKRPAEEILKAANDFMLRIRGQNGTV